MPAEHPLPCEAWLLHLDRHCCARPLPWPADAWARPDPAALLACPEAVEDFARTSPTDGGIETQVPPDLPRELPLTRTRLAFGHDPGHLYAYLLAFPPAAPVPELAADPYEGWWLTFALAGVRRGLYFGLEHTGAHICWPQLWDRELQPADAGCGAPWDRTQTQYGAGGGIAGYDARVIPFPDGVTCAAWRIERGLLAAGFDGPRIRFSAGRLCRRAGESVAFGATATWESRVETMATLTLLDGPPSPEPLPRVRRVELRYDPATERGTVRVAWQGALPGTAEFAHALETCRRRGNYADYLGRATIALNGREETVPLAPVTEASFDLPDGWNRLEVMSGCGYACEIPLEKCSGHRIRPSPCGLDAPFPPHAELATAFARWHTLQEQLYIAPGTWNVVGNPERSLDHACAFVMEPYALACRVFGPQPVWLARVREACERIAAAQTAEGVFLNYHHGPVSEPFLGGAFTHGSASEALLLGYDLLGEAHWLEAARRAFAAYRLYRWEVNHNYAAFALWHIAALIERLGPEPEFLAAARFYARHFVANQMTPGGAHGGHNYYSAYGNITLKGLARLLVVLPPADPDRAWLRERTVRYSNQLLARQQSDGLIAGRNRRYIGYRHEVPGLFPAAWALDPTERERLRPALRAMLAACLLASGRGESGADRGLVLVHAAAWPGGPPPSAPR